MKDKIVPVLFGIISAAVWAATIALIVFSVVLLATGMEKTPEFTLESAVLSKEAPEDVRSGGENWYRLTLNMRVASAKYSPYAYSAQNVRLRGGAPGTDVIRVALDEPLRFSKAEPDSFTLTLYVRSDETPEKLAGRLSELEFSLDDYKGHVAFFDVPFAIYPDFSLSDFAGLKGSLTAQAAAL